MTILPDLNHVFHSNHWELAKKRLLSLLCIIFTTIQMFLFTSVCTMCGRHSLILLTKALMSTAFSLSSCWSRTSRAMMVPVLPTPALRETDRNLVCGYGDDLLGKRSSGVFDRSVPAVNHSGCSDPFCLNVVSQQASELDQDLCALWHSVVGPGSEVKVLHCALLQRFALWRWFAQRNTNSLSADRECER